MADSTATATATTAVQRALLLPEILSLIFAWIRQDRDYFYRGNFDEEEWEYRLSYGREGVLLRCGLVNKLWYAEAMPIMWSSPWSLGCVVPNSLPQFFLNMDPPRRQYYANFVETVTLATTSKEQGVRADLVLRDLKFPKLESVMLRLVDHDGCYIPRVEKQAVKSVDIDPRFEVYPDTYGMSRDEIGSILDQITVGLFASCYV
jgi:hypothetical protein